MPSALPVSIPSSTPLSSPPHVSHSMSRPDAESPKNRKAIPLIDRLLGRQGLIDEDMTLEDLDAIIANLRQDNQRLSLMVLNLNALARES